ncbi:efflux RND transporter permease subunit [Roseisalinus antarcticus]|uniref:MMPL family protein n=1 Tax=Roseisalinus antarcticus TaxID=254357 RepID=A0A1Y5SLL4_9RHOB|nr:MMPL family transporter [Roseisalinus antarcticus]SLN40642.1 MMPL family protein [Roseisalinus antarcticus]
MDGSRRTPYLPRMTPRTRDILQLLAILAVTLLAGWTATGIRMQGDLSRTLQGTSETYQRFASFQETFGTVGGDAVLSVVADDLGAPGSFSALEDLLIELQLTEGVTGVISIFSLPDPEDPERPFLRRPALDDLAPADRLAALHDAVPLAPEMLAEDRSLTLVTVLPDHDMALDDRTAALERALQTAAPALTVHRVGLSQLHLGVSQALARDQIRLMPLSMALSAVLSLILFRSWVAAVICSVPSIVSLAWALGLQTAAGIPVDPLVAMVPTLLVVMTFADTVHLYHAIGKAARDLPPGPAQSAAMSRAVRETWPALFLTSITTGMAFLSLLFVGSPTLNTLAWVGAVGLALVFVVVMLMVPPMARLMTRGPVRLPGYSFAPVRRLALGLLRRPGPVGAAGVALLVILLGMTTLTRPGYDMSHHIPRGTDFARDLAEVEAKLPGSDRLHVVVAAADPAPGLQPADRTRIDAVARAIYGQPISLPDRIDAANPITRRFLAEDGSAFALPVAAPLGTKEDGTRAFAQRLETELANAGLSDVAEVTGYPLMSFTEVSRLVIELRVAFYLAVALVVVLSAVLMRSVRLALASLVPNLLPILGVEAWLVVTGTQLTLTGAIALTIAFGIAVDDTIHLLNRLRIERRSSEGPAAIAAAVNAVTPPVVITSLILILGFSVSALSLLPSIGIFARLTASAVALALVADLFLFPSLLVWASPKESSR